MDEFVDPELVAMKAELLKYAKIAKDNADLLEVRDAQLGGVSKALAEANCCEARQLRMCTEQVSGLTREMMIASFPRRGAATDYVSCQLGVTCHQLFSLRVIDPVRVYGHIPLVDP